MKIVQVKDIGVQVNGISHFKNDTFEVTDKDYEPIKEYVDVIKDDKIQDKKTTNDRDVIIKIDNEEIDLKEVEKYLYDCLENFGKNPEIEQPDGTDKSDNKSDTEKNSGEGKDNSNDDEELEALKDRAKELGIKNVHNMKKETLIAKIEEAEKTEAEGSQNPEGE